MLRCSNLKRQFLQEREREEWRRLPSEQGLLYKPRRPFFLFCTTCTRYRQVCVFLPLCLCVCVYTLPCPARSLQEGKNNVCARYVLQNVCVSALFLLLVVVEKVIDGPVLREFGGTLLDKRLSKWLSLAVELEHSCNHHG